MLNTYLTNQNRLLTMISIVLFLSIMVTVTVEFLTGHPILASAQLVIVLATISCNVVMISKNKAYIKKWNAINEIEQSSFHYDQDDGVRVMKEVVGDLDFKFTKD